MAVTTTSLEECWAVHRIGYRKGIIQVAGDTLGRRSLIDSVAMAGGAVQGAMGTPEREVRQGVPELRDLPEMLKMATSAVGKSAIVNVILLMAECAVLAHPGQTPSSAMTLRTLERIMDARKGEVLVEILRRFPVLFLMAVRTLLAEGSIVRVLVASGAILESDLREEEAPFPML